MSSKIGFVLIKWFLNQNCYCGKTLCGCYENRGTKIRKLFLKIGIILLCVAKNNERSCFHNHLVFFLLNEANIASHYNFYKPKDQKNLGL